MTESYRTHKQSLSSKQLLITTGLGGRNPTQFPFNIRYSLGVGNDEKYMHLALLEAKQSYPDVPIGAVLLNPEGQIVSKASNRRIRDSDPSAHAEILVLREGARELGDWRLQGFSIYVTLEPCLMCAAAISTARIAKVVFGSWAREDDGFTEIKHLIRSQWAKDNVEINGGILDLECNELLVDFFSQIRETKGC